MGVLYARIGNTWVPISSAPLQAQEGTWTPVISSLGTAQPSWGDTDLTPAFQRIGQWCSWELYVGFHTTFNGGTGQIGITLPFPAAGQPTVQAKLWMPAANWDLDGIGYCTGNLVRPLFPRTPTNASLAGLQNADATATPGTGIPTTPGLYPMHSGGSMILGGRYLIAAGS